MFLNVVRIRNLLLHPHQSWSELESEQIPVPRLFTGWILPLAAIPAAASLIGLLLFVHVFMNAYTAYAAYALGNALTTPGIIADAIALYVVAVGSVSLSA